MRQTGILAAAAAYALTHNFPQLPRVHALAKRLEAGLEEIGVAILSRAETCMVSNLCNVPKKNIVSIDYDRFSTTQAPLAPLSKRSQTGLLRSQSPSFSAGRV